MTSQFYENLRVLETEFDYRRKYGFPSSSFKHEDVTQMQEFAKMYDEPGIQNSSLRSLAGLMLALCAYLQQGSTVATRSLLEHVVKLDVTSTSGWNALGHCCWELKDLVAARWAITAGLRRQHNKEGAQMLSMLLRQELLPEADAATTNSTLVTSISCALDAVRLEPSDGYSWYVLAMAYMAFVLRALEPLPDSVPSMISDRNPPTTSAPSDPDHDLKASTADQDIQKRSAAGHPREAAARFAFNAYRVAERSGMSSLADLYYNRATLHTHCHQFQDALKEYARAGELDPGLPSAAQTKHALDVVSNLHQLVVTRAGFSAKQLQKTLSTLTRSISKSGTPASAASKSSPPQTLSSLVEGPNPGGVLVCRLLAIAEPHNPLSLARYWICIDANGTCFVLALRKTSVDIQGDASTNLSVHSPTLTKVSVSARNKEYAFPLVSIDMSGTLLSSG